MEFIKERYIGNKPKRFSTNWMDLGCKLCPECYHHQLIRDYVDDMEFVAIDKYGLGYHLPEPTNESNKANLYKI